MRHERAVAVVAGLVLAGAAPSVFAHTFGAIGAGFAAGFGHPFLGPDHLAAMIAVGVWAAQAGWRPVWRGTNFTLFGSAIALNRDSNYHLLTFDSSAIPALADNANAVFRIYGYASGGGGGRLNFDNVSFIGNCIFPADTPTSTPSPTAFPPLSVIINEVAWSGTAAGSTDEWFELHNPTAAPINLAGWMLESDDGNPNFALSGTIDPGDYFVVARSASIFNDLVPDLVNSSFSFENTGEILILLDPNGNQVDTANVDDGAWPAGLGSPTFASMARQGVVPARPPPLLSLPGGRWSS